MHHPIGLLKFGFAFLIVIWAAVVRAQQPVTAPPARSAAPVPIDIIHADSISLKKVNDSTNLTVLQGAVLMKQGNTVFKCDRCEKNDRANTFEAWGNVHIIDADTTNIYSGHLQYLIAKQIAYLDKNVKLTDGHATLTTPDLTYNMATKIATYTNGGKVVNRQTVITSKEAFYYTDIKDVYFKKNVLVNDPAYRITTDSLLYNTESQIARFIAMTNIKDSANRTIDTKEGFYNLKNGEAQFGQRPFINDGKGTTLNADNVSLNSNLAKAEGSAVLIDTVRKTTVIGNLIYQNRITDAFLATQKPLMIVKQDEDSIYITADTLFSAKLTDLYVVSPALGGDSIKVKPDSLGLSDTLQQYAAPVRKVTALKEIADSAAATAGNSIVLPSSTNPEHRAAVRDSMAAGPIKNVPDRVRDEPAVTVPVTGAVASGKKEPPPVKTTRTTDNDSTNRYFEAFHNVKIYSDSLQAVSDSLFYSFKDSTFRLYQRPVIWGKESQITGDTILLHTKNKQMDHLEAFKNGFMVNHIEAQAYNQIKGTRIDGYFTDGSLDSMQTKGSVESLYFVQDDDSAFVGVNEVTSDILDAYFAEKKLNKIVFRSEATGTFSPIKDKKPEETKLKGFIWREAERPKTKYDLMQ
ncbi:OstA family protein [Niabella ginsenosidivorans]|uniref:OstA family protein n=1 Tax=Niabella ginsenosidivorans TaxID=1176587 RepID=A0A1A9HWT3_9BACT|nr:OstA-like protein [Niabella ginsenosidivorans]ANH79846.1 OstA family protein [Niabella ginsenosidivorans]